LAVQCIMPNVKTIDDVDLAGKKVLVRVDFNVPLDEKGNVADNTRIVAALPTIQKLVDQGAKVILCSHLGRPKGERNMKYSLKPVAAELSKLIKRPVTFVDECIGEAAKKTIDDMHAGDIALLENLRFHKEEEANDEHFSKALAQLAEAYVNDAFGTAHRAHASTVGVTHFLPIAVAGKLMAKELDYLGGELNNPEKPFVVILGGAKVSDKINVINALLDKASCMLIGGAMAYTFALAEGRKVGNSPVEQDKVDIALEAMDKAKRKGVRMLLPLDNLITDDINFKERKLGTTEYIISNIPNGWEGIDIGPKTVKAFSEEIAKAKTILWNGPMGLFEIEKSAQGTREIAKAVAANASAVSIIGGGDSVKAINESGYADKVSFMSTGGGASLELLEGKELPGVAALNKNLVKL